jgi:hypothetical protein
MAQGGFEHRGSQVSSKTNTSGRTDYPLSIKRVKRRRSGSSRAFSECCIQIEKGGRNDICYAGLGACLFYFHALEVSTTAEADAAFEGLAKDIL